MLEKAKWMKDAVPTTKGWVNRQTGELLLARKYSEAEIHEWDLANGGKILGKTLEKDETPVKKAKSTKRKAAKKDVPVVEEGDDLEDIFSHVSDFTDQE